ncbi:DUF1028 domain-containing protein [Roseinatronobacter bogoriensis]|uniref:DUF1028 domain-containing protein n=1 Tax=Roseinatronobacter bogoriensis subsp. barguzinensis TaxID=441209 RepID=A0A2K8KCP6_9RHOB|nr:MULTISPECIES: DUF1028 domain-containing protein [Rhodobaca]ATX67217.1 DUF1028 domain-containing protein [Rhodobaca barguzinensis]MBB4206763.1 putative Ntn-hydrolase superfamily protein [Rhodobaca bogoriensis DSM 18756]TDW41507.1 putative Ntn-hydrolase superfamily protein [Rhodobaca barguzinensis]TDY74315.1 putative Ntn-hydrolase superfamily protein [Rhodobaca bogoriensis DSM 18756]
MTFSILAQDLSSGAIGGAAATGALCVGGWVLRGDSRAGISASQGAAPSTIWGEDALERMRQGRSASEALTDLVGADRGREWRQLALLDRAGGTACHTGTRNTDWKGVLDGPGFVVSGNMLAGPQVLGALRDAYVNASGSFAQRLLAALSAAEAAGGDIRGLQSAALLVVSDDTPPLSLRVDWSETPVDALHDLFRRSQSGDYAAWLPTVPTRNDPERGHD